MNLLEQCQAITLSDQKPKQISLELGEQFLTTGFRDASQHIIQYPFALDHRKVYLYIWNFHSPSELMTSICPYQDNLAFSCRFTHGQKTQAHVQDFIELAYVVKGELKQRILDKDITFQEGELCLLDRNCVHQDYLLDNSSVILFLCLRNDALLEIMNENITTQKIITFLQGALMEQKEMQQYIHFKPSENATPKMEELFSLLLKELWEENVGSHLIVKGLLMRIFRLLSTQFEFQLSKQQKKDMNWAIYEDICHYMETHYKTVTIQELSKVFHFQEDYFNRLFRKRTGKTYCETLQNIRLFRAEEFLLHTDMTISEIAEEVGYRNKSYFYKLFTEKYGMTPAEYRSQA